MSMIPDIEIQHLSVCFDTAQGPVYAVSDPFITFRAGYISSVIRKSDSGKSVMGMSLLHLLPNTARAAEKYFFGEGELHSMPLRRLRRLQGVAIDLIPQNPGASLGPVMKLHRQLIETITAHGRWKRGEAETQAAELLRHLGFEEPERILNQYSFQMSGSMNQRLVSVLGPAYRSGQVITDESTKGLDAVIRNQVYSILRQIYTEHHCSTLVITHDLALARRLYGDIWVLYMDRIIEQGTAEEVMERPRHLYAAGLIHSLPSRGMVPIPPPGPGRLEYTDCPFYPRYPRAMERCNREASGEVALSTGGKMRCSLYE